jgi:two-component system chemotaxis sensor kinase CheA
VDDLISEFIAETSESLELLDSELVELEQNPNDEEILGNIFRLVHTIKGTCGFLGLPRLASVAHAGENILGKVRDGDIQITPEAISIVLESLDTIKDLIEYLTENGSEPEGDDTTLIAKLNAFADNNGADAPGADDNAAKLANTNIAASEEAPSEGGGTVTQAEMAALEAAFAGADSEFAVAIPQEFLVDNDDDTADTDTEDVAAAKAMEQAATAPSPPVEAPKAAPAKTANITEKTKETAIKQGMQTPAVEKKQGAGPQQSIRVNIDVLEDLMQMVGELVLTRNQLLQVTRDNEEQELTSPLQQLSQITSELQEGIMKTRMQPVSVAWSKFPRLIRDLSQDLSKKINLEMIGEGTEVDRQLLDAIKDPLTHMVRNSCDHGLETPQERLDSGKSEDGTVTLSARHEGGYIIIEIADNGRGINLERVTQKILENELATEEQLATMSDEQIAQFIFKAGFSTAEQVTSVSGRGVGMDVVRTNIEKIGGAVSLKSVPGEGSTFHIKIPLTLAIVSVLIVQSRGQRFAIPQLNVSELLSLSDDSEHQIETIQGASLLRLRKKLLPMLPLGEVLKLETPEALTARLDSDKAEIENARIEKAANAANVGGNAAKADKANADDITDNADSADNNEHAENAKTASAKAALDDDAALSPLEEKVEYDKYAAIITVGIHEFGILVDRVHDTEEIVVKATSRVLDDLSVYAGNTILGDGSVIMILDPNGLAQSVVSGEIAPKPLEDASKQARDHSTAYLLFSASDGSQKAVPLELVSRLEEIDADTVEHTGNIPVVQYRDDLMQLKSLDDKPLASSGNLTVIVFSYDNRSVGLVVHEIIDIVKAPTDIRVAADNPLYMGGLVIADKTTDVLDVAHLLQDCLKTSDHHADTLDAERISSLNLLFVEDSPFFRKMTLNYFTSLGMNVVAVASGEEGLEALRKTMIPFDVIVTDVEMPEMDGFAFAKNVRMMDAYTNTPMYAFTSTVNQEALDRAEESNMSGVINKTNRDALIESLNKHMKAREVAA